MKINFFIYFLGYAFSALYLKEFEIDVSLNKIYYSISVLVFKMNIEKFIKYMIRNLL